MQVLKFLHAIRGEFVPAVMYKMAVIAAPLPIAGTFVHPYEEQKARLRRVLVRYLQPLSARAAS